MICYREKNMFKKIKDFFSGNYISESDYIRIINKYRILESIERLKKISAVQKLQNAESINIYLDKIKIIMEEDMRKNENPKKVEHIKVNEWGNDNRMVPK